jgi:hypothetical protein
VSARRRHFGHVRRFASGRYQGAYWHEGRRHVAPRTFNSRADANAFLDAVSDFRQSPVMVRSWYADLAAQTPGVARSSYRLLKVIFNTAISGNLILMNPCRVKGGGTDRVTDWRIPEVNQFTALTQAMPDQYRAAVIVAA